MRIRDLAKTLKVPVKKLAQSIATKRGRKYHYLQPLAHHANEGDEEMEEDDQPDSRMAKVVVPSLRQVVVDYPTAAALALQHNAHPHPADLGPRWTHDSHQRGSRGSRGYDAGRRRTKVVALMGHVNHGKTSVLDALAGSECASAEPGSITQVVRMTRLLLPVSVEKEDGGGREGGKGEILGPHPPFDVDRAREKYRHDGSIRGGTNKTVSKAEKKAAKAAWKASVDSVRKVASSALKSGTHVPLTLLDTPGHEAFFPMREASVLALSGVLLVVDAQVGLADQALEVLTAAAVENIPVWVLANKMDVLPDSPQAHDAALTRIASQLAAFTPFEPLPLPWEHPLPRVSPQDLLGPQAEELHVDVRGIFPISAKTKDGMDALVSSLASFASSPSSLSPEIGYEDGEENDGSESGSPVVPALGMGTVVEASLDRARGSVLRMVVREGTVSKGDTFVCGVLTGRVLSVTDESQVPLDTAGPGEGVQVMVSIKSGIKGVSSINDALPLGEEFFTVSPADAKVLMYHREASADWHMNMATAEIVSYSEDGVEEEVVVVDEEERQVGEDGYEIGEAIVLKADSAGTLVTLLDAIRTQDSGIRVVHYGIGDVTPTDLEHAALEPGECRVICFNTSVPPPLVKRAASLSVPILGFDVFTHLLRAL